MVNGNWNGLTNDEKMLRASVVGVAGKRLEMEKDAKKGTPQAQADRGNDFSMKGRNTIQTAAHKLLASGH